MAILEFKFFFNERMIEMKAGGGIKNYAVYRDLYVNEESDIALIDLLTEEDGHPDAEQAYVIRINDVFFELENRDDFYDILTCALGNRHVKKYNPFVLEMERLLERFDTCLKYGSSGTYYLEDLEDHVEFYINDHFVIGLPKQQGINGNIMEFEEDMERYGYTKKK
jgi:hypothetical protein